MHTFKKAFSVAALILMTTVSCFAAEGTVITNALNIRSAPSTDSTIISKAYKGEILDITSKKDSFYKISLDGKEAYASCDYVSVIVKSTGVVTADRLNVRTGPSSFAAPVGQLVYGDEVNLTGISGDWYEILLFGELRFIHSDYVSVRDAASLASRSGIGFSRDASRLVNYSKNFIGTPYVSGGSSPSGFDCSGFTSYVYKQFGISLPRTSASQAEIGTFVKRSDLAPGDLVFFNTYGGISHVGIFVGGNSFIHATVPGDVVKVSSLDASYYSSRYVTARRILN